MSKHTFQRDDKLVYGFWLVFQSLAAGGGVRIARQTPSVGRDERAMYVELSVPAALFETPTLRATIQVGDMTSDLPAIDIHTASDALKAALGVDVDLVIRTVEDQPS